MLEQKLFLLLFEYAQKNETLQKVSSIVTRASSKVFFIVYLVLLANLYLFNKDELLRNLAVPFVVLCYSTSLRSIIRRPRPYESLGIKPNGKSCRSCPSNHSACAMIIAFMGLQQNIYVGIILILLAVCTGISRVLTGAHYPSDVVFAFLLSISIFSLSTLLPI